MNEKVKFKGVVFELDKIYIVPALSLGQVKQMTIDMQKRKELEDAGQAPEFNTNEANMALVLQAFQRNYPDMTLERLMDIVDMNEFEKLIQAVMGRSGLQLTKEVPESGEALATQ